MYSETLVDGLVAAAPPLVGWTAAVVVAALLLRRRGARAERFLLIGASVKLFKAGIDIIAPSFNLWLTAGLGLDSEAATGVIRIFDIGRECVGLAGIVLLVIAFWFKFVSEKPAPVKE